eukprot:5231390-Pleurochrysis_carterae.AAC.3
MRSSSAASAELHALQPKCEMGFAACRTVGQQHAHYYLTGGCTRHCDSFGWYALLLRYGPWSAWNWSATMHCSMEPSYKFNAECMTA